MVLFPVTETMSRYEWPELVGKPWKEAEQAIRRDYPNMSIQVVRENSSVRKDVRPDRVRIVMKGDGTVARPPYIG